MIHRKPIVERTEYARPPDLDPGGYQERKGGEWALRLADQVVVTPRCYVLTRSWLRGTWPEEFYRRKM